MQSESEGEDDIENDEFLKMAKYLQSMHNSLYIGKDLKKRTT